MEKFDLVVIGAGPGGYTGAIRASQLGMKVACIDKRKNLGGTCLNVGCIPSKALLNFSHKYLDAREHFTDIGIKGSINLDLKKMMSRKDKIVSDLCKGIEMLFVKNKITRFIGSAKIISPNIVEINHKDKIEAKNILIATGSESIDLPNIKIDEKKIVSSTGGLSLEKIPKELVVIGGGYIGLELGSVWSRLGSNVRIVEFADSIVPSMDKEIAKMFHKILQKQGLNFSVNTKVTKANISDKTVKLEIEDKSGQKEDISCDVALVCVGRKPNTEIAGDINITLDEFSRIKTNDHFQTNIPNIYAIGDVISGPMLAHKAEHEAVSAVEIMSGGVHLESFIPSVVYTHPEVASVGATEEELKDAGINYKVGKFPFLANSRARTMESTDGMVKILSCSKSDKILGAHILGPEAGNIIGELVICMEFGGSAEDIAKTCHAHPTLSEAIKEAALQSESRSINI